MGRSHLFASLFSFFGCAVIIWSVLNEEWLWTNSLISGVPIQKQRISFDLTHGHVYVKFDKLITSYNLTYIASQVCDSQVEYISLVVPNAKCVGGNTLRWVGSLVELADQCDVDISGQLVSILSNPPFVYIDYIDNDDDVIGLIPGGLGGVLGGSNDDESFSQFDDIINIDDIISIDDITSNTEFAGRLAEIQDTCETIETVANNSMQQYLLLIISAALLVFVNTGVITHEICGATVKRGVPSTPTIIYRRTAIVAATHAVIVLAICFGLITWWIEYSQVSDLVEVGQGAAIANIGTALLFLATMLHIFMAAADKRAANTLSVRTIQLGRVGRSAY